MIKSRLEIEFNLLKKNIGLTNRNHPLYLYFKSKDLSSIRSLNQMVLKIKKVENYNKLIYNIKNANNFSQLQDLIAELKVGYILIKDHLSLTYEPNNLKKPPEYRLNSNSFLEVKAIGNLEKRVIWNKIQKEFDIQIGKINKPLAIGLHLNDDNYSCNSGLFKKIKKQIMILSHNSEVAIYHLLLLENGKIKLQKEHDYVNWPILSKNLGQVDIHTISSTPAVAITTCNWGEINEKNNISNQLRAATKKTLPSKSSFDLVLVGTVISLRGINRILDQLSSRTKKFRNIYYTDFDLSNLKLTKYK